MNRFSSIRHRAPWAFAVAGALAFAAAGCGSSSSSGGSKTSLINQGQGGASAASATSLGAKAGKAEGGKITLPAKKIGMISIVNGLESTDHANQTLQQAAKMLGWTVTICDGQGNPQKWITCGNTLLNQGVDAILEDAIDPTQLKPVLSAAKAKGVPVIEVTGQVSPGMLAFYPDEAKSGRILSQFLVKKLQSAPGGAAGIGAVNYAAAWAKSREAGLTSALSQQSKAKIVATAQTDAGNLVKGTQKQVSDMLTAHPDMKAMWFSWDDAGQAGAQEVALKMPGKQYPDRPYITTFHAQLSTLDLMRKGVIDAVDDVNWDAAEWVAMDKLAEFFGRKKPIPTEPRPTYPGAGDLYQDTIITKANMPPEGQYVKTKIDVTSFFDSKWKTEFGSAG